MENPRLLKHYVNPMTYTEVITVEDKNFTICKLPADLAIRLSVRVATTVAPIIPLLGKEKDLMKEIPNLNLDHEKLSDFILDVVCMCQVVDKDTGMPRMVSFDKNDIYGLKMPFLLGFEFLKLNFESFFADSPLAKKVVETAEGINLEKMMPK